MLWWEKTVEYYFVKKYVNLDMLIAPMDGNEEKAADAILSNVDSWILIEFKRSIRELSSEHNKFEDYESAKLILSGKDSHHFLIYGKLDEEGEFALDGQTYFSRNKTDVNNVVNLGIKQNKFIQYLVAFLKFKEGSDGTASGGVGSYPHVAGISNNGSITKCMSLREFSEQINLQLALQEKQEINKKQTKSFGHGISLQLTRW